ncbi:MAG TPA: hypothetical protein DEB40_12355 [Elusimicrobia bacterium]|nr:hypothetical protein [Elusimicrobiota bacterium]HBT62526.1 hypothetical protein [Elusimicrobiota bacterium]
MLKAGPVKAVANGAFRAIPEPRLGDSIDKVGSLAAPAIAQTGRLAIFKADWPGARVGALPAVVAAEGVVGARSPGLEEVLPSLKSIVAPIGDSVLPEYLERPYSLASERKADKGVGALPRLQAPSALKAAVPEAHRRMLLFMRDAAAKLAGPMRTEDAPVAAVSAGDSGRGRLSASDASGASAQGLIDKLSSPAGRDSAEERKRIVGELRDLILNADRDENAGFLISEEFQRTAAKALGKDLRAASDVEYLGFVLQALRQIASLTPYASVKEDVISAVMTDASLSLVPEYAQYRLDAIKMVASIAVTSRNLAIMRLAAHYLNVLKDEVRVSGQAPEIQAQVDRIDEAYIAYREILKGLASTRSTGGI